MLIWSAIFIVLACGAALYGYGLPIAGYAWEVQIAAWGAGIIGVGIFLAWAMRGTSQPRA